jgi:tRNA G10  N-methylase Trm11
MLGYDSNMKYFFILGNNPALSIAEVLTVLKPEVYNLLSQDFLLVETSLQINPANLIKRLGGIIKIGEIKKEIKKTNHQDELIKIAFQLAFHKISKVKPGKFNFGFSDYSRRFNIKDLGLKIKKEFNKKQISSRFVVSREENLSSVVVEQNKLIDRGIEIALAVLEDRILLGETLAVQAFKSLSFRDYGRPARDDKSGLLPPKLAQIMINLAQVEDRIGLIVDPFCGSGTILSEAMLMDYTNLFGFDFSFKAIQGSKENIDWIRREYDLKDVKVRLLVKNALDLSKFMKTESVSAFITEPYLGPQRGKIEFSLVIKELEYLYTKVLTEFYKTLLPGGRVVMVWPVFYGNHFINPEIFQLKRIDLLPDKIKANKVIKKHLSSRNTIIYGRKGQKVFREVVVLEK